jgi:hypothetical protein
LGQLIRDVADTGARIPLTDHGQVRAYLVPRRLVWELDELRAVERYCRSKGHGGLGSEALSHAVARHRVVGTEQEPAYGCPDYEIWWTEAAISTFEQIHAVYPDFSGHVFDVISTLGRAPAAKDEDPGRIYGVLSTATHRVAYDVDADLHRVYVVHVQAVPRA